MYLEYMEVRTSYWCEPVLSFHHIDSGDQTQVVKLGCKCLYLLSHLVPLHPLIFKFLFIIVCMHDMCVNSRAMAWHIFYQRTTLRSWFFPFTFVWVPGIKLSSPGLYSKCLYLLSLLTGSQPLLFFIFSFLEIEFSFQVRLPPIFSCSFCFSLCVRYQPLLET